jgi:hypothetical protein
VVADDPCAKERVAFGAFQAYFAGFSAGGIAGGPSNDYSTMAARYPDPEMLAQAINVDLQREAKAVDEVAAAFGRLRECRVNVARGIREEPRLFERGAGPRRKARVLFNRERRMEELALADQYRAAMSERDQGLRAAVAALEAGQALASVASSASTSASPSASGGEPARALVRASLVRQVVVAATETVPEKRREFANSISAARTKDQAVFDLDEDFPPS